MEALGEFFPKSLLLAGDIKAWSVTLLGETDDLRAKLLQFLVGVNDLLSFPAADSFGDLEGDLTKNLCGVSFLGFLLLAMTRDIVLLNLACCVEEPEINKGFEKRIVFPPKVYALVKPY